MSKPATFRFIHDEDPFLMRVILKGIQIPFQIILFGFEDISHRSCLRVHICSPTKGCNPLPTPPGLHDMFGYSLRAADGENFPASHASIHNMARSSNSLVA